MSQELRTMYLVVCAGPPALRIGELAELLRADRWDVHLVLTPVTASWLDHEALARVTGNPVRFAQRLPHEPSTLPPAEAALVVPATFNTINKWTGGISDTLALDVLNDLLGTDVPVVACPYAKPSLINHPAFGPSLATLRAQGVQVTLPNAIAPVNEDGPFRWEKVLDVFRQHCGRD